MKKIPNSFHHTDRYLLSTSSQDADCYSVTPEHTSCIKLNNQTKISKTGSGL